MHEGKAREILQELIDSCGRAIRDAERLAQDKTDAPLIDVVGSVLRAKARGCLSALNTGDQDECRALIRHIAAAKESPLWPSMASALGLRPTDDWLTGDAGPEPNPSGGERQILIHCDEMVKGWVYIHAEMPPADPTMLPHMLNDAFCRWLKQNGKLTVRATLPIVAGGNTVGYTCSLSEPIIRTLISGVRTRHWTRCVSLDAQAGAIPFRWRTDSGDWQPCDRDSTA